MRKTALLLLTLTLSGCGSDGPGAPSSASDDDRRQTVAALQSAWRLWQATGPASYRYTYRRACFCLERGPVVVTVRDRRLESVVDAGTGQPVSPESLALYGPVERLFSQLFDAVAQQAWSIRASYDERLGYPRDSYVDVSIRQADEEQGFSVAGFEPL